MLDNTYIEFSEHEAEAQEDTSSLLVKADLNWNVQHRNTFYEWGDPIVTKKPTGKSALVRSDTGAMLSGNASKNWRPVQNATALAFFEEFCRAGDMRMERAGHLGGGRFVYAYARLEDEFELPGQDRVGAFLLFLNPHIVGKSVNVMFSPRRFYCQNQLPMLLKQSDGRFRHLHTAAFDPEEVKVALGMSQGMFGEFRRQAEFLVSKRFTDESLQNYFNRVFPQKAENDNGMGRRAMLCLANLDSQPGAEASQGSWWHAFNTVTYVTDHVLGRSADSRLANAWFGWTRQRKVEALQLALKMAA